MKGFLVMAEYNFEPDYEVWWNKPDLGKEDIIWLLFGLNPNDVARHRELSKNDSKTHEEQPWYWGFGNYFDQKDPFLARNFHQHNELLEWKNDKSLLVKDAYEGHLQVNGGLLDFLIDADEYSRNPDLEDYKDTAKYLFDFDKSDLENVGREEEAFSLLLGLNPEFFIRFKEVDTKASKRRGSKSDFTAYVDLEPQDKWFYSSYRDFLKVEYKYLEMVPDQYLLRAYKKAKDLNLWKGAFKGYAQSLYDEGFRFKAQTYEWLKDKGIDLKYSNDAWAISFYERWLKECVWSLQYAMYLFQGRDPRKDKRHFEDLSQNPFLINPMRDDPSAWDIYDEGFYDVDKRLAKYVTAGSIEEFEHNDVAHYKPKDIIVWLLEHIPVNPPEALLEVVLSEEKKNDYGQGKLNKEKEAQEASEAKSKSQKWSDLKTMQKKERDKILFDVALKIYEKDTKLKLNALHGRVKIDPIVSNDNISEANWKTFLKPIIKTKLDKAIAEKRAKAR